MVTEVIMPPWAWKQLIESSERERNMIESEDGTVTGSIDVTALGDIDPKTDEAKAQLEQLQAESKAAEEKAKEQEKAAEEDEKAAAKEEKKADVPAKAAPKAPSHSSTDKG